MTVLTQLRDMPICCAISHFKLCLWFTYLVECESLNFFDVGRLRALRGDQPSLPLSVDTVGHVTFLN